MQHKDNDNVKALLDHNKISRGVHDTVAVLQADCQQGVTGGNHFYTTVVFDVFAHPRIGQLAYCLLHLLLLGHLLRQVHYLALLLEVEAAPQCPKDLMQ